MTSPDPWTVGRLLTWTTDYLKRSGADNPRLDAEVLLAHARGCERIALYTAYADEVSEEERAAFRDLVKRRAEGTPVAYLVGRREFFSLLYEVTPAVLIPRPETEFVVTAVLDALKERPADAPPALVADVGTGSGAIAIAVAKHAPGCRVIAVDISAEAIVVARRNAETHDVGRQIEFLEGDLLAPVAAEQKFDIIAANLPYIGQNEKGTLDEGVRRFEPHQALWGGPIGDELIVRIIPQAAERLVSGGLLALEASPLIADRVAGHIKADGRFDEATVANDLAGLARVIQARRL